ncbi:serine/threonine-protein phosphatase 4 regulatory subunit 3-like [Temnothorax curvispinosus]|uniref:Serine/threonine-protein phosphatase 4 regulatory subunit 3-like n=1 Tax=Temnothorax curvispinosus TaxID=300111 RepID=A0A6J1PHF9_9HYME|nr:serine/threonine-protein phosphatase 4 regulatory subunit 3-like [Temnothorax curvispinosus]
MTDDGRRVKLYILNADKQWDELGTGLVFSECFDLQLSKLTCLEVKAEGNNTLMLSSPVQPDKKYRREVNSMTWFEADCVYITLHFQEEAGCDEIWEKICQVLGKDLSLEIPQDIMENPENERSDDVSDIYSYRLLEKSFTVEHLEDFNTFLKTCITSPIRRETLLLHLLKINVKNYFAKLVRNIHFYKESGILTGDVLHTTLRNLSLIRSNLVLITILYKKANSTSQIESLLQELNL